MAWSEQESRDFTIMYPQQRILGTTFPVQVTVRSNRDELKNLLKKKSGDIVEGASIDEAVANSKRYVDRLLDR
jgi:hypothetical protein